MGVLVPEIVVFNTIKAIIDYIRFDYEERVDETTTLLYKICNGNVAQRYDLFEQAKAVFITERDNSRELDVNMFFNMERARIPTIHITLPSEQADKDGMGIDEGYQGYEEVTGIGDDVGSEQQGPIYTRRFNTQYQIVITSDNTNEVLTIYHVLRAIMIPMIDSLNAEGLENIKLSGRDIQNMQTIVPEHVFIRSIGLYFEYEVSLGSLFPEDIVQKILVSYTILPELPSGNETSQSLIPITESCDPVTITDSEGNEIVLKNSGETYAIGTHNVTKSDGTIIETAEFNEDTLVADSRVSNSDDTYDVNVKATDSLELPDVTHTDSDGSDVSLPAMTPMVCTPGVTSLNVSNSNGSYSADIVEDLELPDITITEPDASTSTAPAVTNIDVRDYKSGIAYRRPQLTGQLTSYRTGDDAWHLANGTYDYTPPLYPTSYAQLDPGAITPFTTLLNNNVFGNKERYTDDAGGQIYANGYIIDHLTGLGWYNYDLGDGIWNTHIDTAHAATTLGYADWRLPNIEELYSILNKGQSNMLSGSPFSNLNSLVIRTSSTRIASTSNAWYASTSTGVINPIAKTSSFNIRGCQVRNHYT